MMIAIRMASEVSGMWQVKVFRIVNGNIEAARKQAQQWRARNESRYQLVEIFVNNAFGYEYRALRIIG